jgi:type I restriction enzyme S subunit
MAKYRFGDICKVLNGRAYKQNELLASGKYPILRVGNFFSSDRWYYSDMELPEDKYCDYEDLLFAWSASFGPKIWDGEKVIYHYHIWKLIPNDDIADKWYLYYWLRHSVNRLTAGTHGSVMAHMTKGDMENQSIELPSLQTQRKISSILRTIDEKIHNNVAINNNLEQQAQAIFANEFLSLDTLPEGWKQASLIDIADYLNGLAMQKYRPTADETGIPVLKIKELRQGCCDDNSELCSPSIKSEYIIRDGDVIFSWSGSLLVDFWCGGICGLNQHLFKVTSNKYNKWFYYAWTKHHLDRFIAVAVDKATTMGHIKRDELSKAEVLIPNEADYKRIETLLQPIYDLIIANRIENKKLAETRDFLLPRLISGELDVSDIDL